MRAWSATVLLLPALAAAGERPLQSALDPHAPPAELIATLTWWLIGTFGVVFVAVMLVGGAALWRGRAQARTLSDRASRNLVLAAGVVVPLIVLVALVVGSVMVGQAAARVYAEPATTVEVIGRQWWWELRYLDRDGAVQAVGANELRVPAGEPVRLLLRSADVIHSFWAPNLDGKTDMIPGMTNVAWLRVNAPGVYRGQCAEYCGTQHALMAFEVVAQPPAAFADWLQQQAQPATAAALADEVGRRLFRDKGCATCHSVRGTEARGARGPDLTHVASRRTLAAATTPNNRGHLAGWVLDPHGIKPGSLMPPTLLQPDELDALLDYLQALQ